MPFLGHGEHWIEAEGGANVLKRLKQWRMLPAVLALALAVWACEPVEPGEFDDPGLPDIENDFDDGVEP